MEELSGLNRLKYIIYSFYKFKLISLYNFFQNIFVHLHRYNSKDYSCRKSKNLVVALSRYALIEYPHF